MTFMINAPPLCRVSVDKWLRDYGSIFDSRLAGCSSPVSGEVNKRSGTLLCDKQSSYGAALLYAYERAAILLRSK